MKTERLLSILLLLLRERRVPAKELAETFEVSLRTIYRDIESLAKAGIPVHATPGNGGGIEIMEHYKVSSSVFTHTDLVQLLSALRTLSAILPNPQLSYLETKIQSFIPNDQSNRVMNQSNQIAFDDTRWLKRNRTPSSFQMVQEALTTQQVLSILYVDQHDTFTRREVEPHQLVWKEHTWYLYGYCRLREEFRLFRFSRMKECTVLATTFLWRNPPKLETDGTLYFEQLSIPITLRIHRSLIDELLDYSTLEDFQPDGDQHYLVLFPFIENDYFYRLLIGFGWRCEVIEPTNVRLTLQGKLKQVLRLYE